MPLVKFAKIRLDAREKLVLYSTHYK